MRNPCPIFVGMILALSSGGAHARIYNNACISVYDEDYTELRNECGKPIMVCWEDDNGRGTEIVGRHNTTRVAKWHGSIRWSWIYEDDFDHGERCKP